MKKIKYFILIIIALIAVFPIVFTICNAFSEVKDILETYGAVLTSFGGITEADYGEYVTLSMFPGKFTIEQFKTVLLYRVEDLMAFWNSVRYSAVIVIFQLIISSLAAYGYARLNFRFKNFFYFICIVIMIMPQQVTLVPNFYVLNKLGWLDTTLAVTVPAIFSTFGVFLLTQYMKDIPYDVSEAARIDGAGELMIFRKIILPQTKGAVAAFLLLSFVEQWNMVETPLVFLKNSDLFPLSLLLNSTSVASLGTAFAIGTIFMIFPLILYFICEDDLIDAIGHADVID